jgi:hypothetical protein
MKEFMMYPLTKKKHAQNLEEVKEDLQTALENAASLLNIPGHTQAVGVIGQALVAIDALGSDKTSAKPAQGLLLRDQLYRAFNEAASCMYKPENKIAMGETAKALADLEAQQQKQARQVRPSPGGREL